MKLVGFVFGIKFKSFSVKDNLGSIADTILYSDNSKFNSDFFPKIQTSSNEIILLNEDNGNQLTINHENIVFIYHIKNNQMREFEDYLEAYERTVYNIFEKYNIGNISRFGFVVKSELKEYDNFLSDVIEKIDQTSNTLQGFLISYNCTRKTPIEKKKSYTKDYNNMFVSYVNESDKDEIFHLIDFQKYYNPPLKVIMEAKPKYSNFCKNKYKYMISNYGSLQKENKEKES